jgi:hypothetical protein
MPSTRIRLATLISIARSTWMTFALWQRIGLRTTRRNSIDAAAAAGFDRNHSDFLTEIILGALPKMSRKLIGLHEGE